MTLTEEFNNWITRIEKFSLTIPFFNLKIGFHDKTLKFYRIVAIIAIVAFLMMWIFVGYESTLMRLIPDAEAQALPRGVGVHFGTIIFTVGSFLALTYGLERAGFSPLRNGLYSAIVATGFINGIFEVIYTVLYDLIHHQALWINAPFLYREDLKLLALYPTYRNWYWFLAGILFVYLLKNHYKKLEWVWKRPDAKWMYIGIIMSTMWAVWIFYPWYFIPVRGSYFPQYIYGFMADEIVPEWIPEENIVTLVETNWKAVYVENTGVRIINEITKLFHFVFFTYLLIPKKKHLRH